MTAVAKHLASTLNVLLEKRIVLVRRERAGWVAALESGETVRAPYTRADRDQFYGRRRRSSTDGADGAGVTVITEAKVAFLC